jgi:hypothetical protein
MDKIFKFSLLKYRPSYLLDEQVNVAILFLFLEDNKVFFCFPNNLERLSALYPDVDIKDITLSLHEFGKKASKLTSKHTLKATNLDTLIEKEFLIADANCFFFSGFKTGMYESPEKIVEHFMRKYFAAYEQYRQKMLHYALDLFEKPFATPEMDSKKHDLLEILFSDNHFVFTKLNDESEHINSPAPSASALSSHSE